MKKAYLLLTLIIFSITITQGQGNKSKLVDSLLTALDNHPQKDSMKTVILMRLADLYIRNNNKKAIEYYQKAIEAAQGGIRNNVFIASQYMGIGIIYVETAQFDKALENQLKAVKLLEGRYPLKLGDVYVDIAYTFISTKDLPKSDHYLKLAEDIFRGKKDTIGMLGIYNGRGVYYQNLPKFDSAEYIMKRGIEVAHSFKDYWSEMSFNTNIGLMYKKVKKYDESIAHFYEAIAIARREDFMPDVGHSLYNNLACGYSAAGKYSIAKPFFDSSLLYAIRNNNAKTLGENYRNMAEMYGNMKDYQLQAKYLQMHYAIKDSLYTLEKSNQITQMEADYNLDKKSEEILRQQAAVTKEKGARNLFILIASFALLALIGLFYFFSRSKKINKVITKQKNELQVLNDLKNRLFGIISHDLRNPLVTLRSYLTLTENPSLAPEKRAELTKQTRDMVTQTTDMLDNLLVWSASQIKNSTVQINHTDIEEVLQLTADMVSLQAQQKNIALSIESEEGTMALADKNLLSIVCRNLLTNAIKFTEAGGKVDVQTTRNNGHVHVTFSDSGIGMSPELIQQIKQNKAVSAEGTNLEKGTGLGIFLVKELVQKMNGELQIESKEGKGSVFTVVLDAA